jgi:hypothetical protein
VIRNYEQLAQTREQLARAEECLIEWRRKLGSTEHKNYRVYTEAWADMVLKLRAEIDEFLGIVPSGTEDNKSANGHPTSNQTTSQVATS